METHSRKTIVVPWDFTDRSEKAVQHALLLAQVVGDNVMLVHFTKRPPRFAGSGIKTAHRETIEQIQNAMEADVRRLQTQCDIRMCGDEPSTFNEPFSIRRKLYPVGITSQVLVCRDPREGMQRLAEESVDVNLIVSSQYYPSGKAKEWDLVRFFRKVKLDTRGIIPFIIVNHSPRHAHYSQLVVPMEWDNSYKEKLQWVMHLSLYYHCDINFMKAHYRVERKKKGLSNNLYFTKKVLEPQNIVYGMKTAARDQEFSGEIFAFAQSIDADLLVVNSDKMETFFPTGQVEASVAVMFINSLAKRYQAFY